MMTPSGKMIPRRLQYNSASHLRTQIRPNHFSAFAAVGFWWLRIGPFKKNVPFLGVARWVPQPQARVATQGVSADQFR